MWVVVLLPGLRSRLGLPLVHQIPHRPVELALFPRQHNLLVVGRRVVQVPGRGEDEARPAFRCGCQSVELQVRAGDGILLWRILVVVIQYLYLHIM